MKPNPHSPPILVTILQVIPSHPEWIVGTQVLVRGWLAAKLIAAGKASAV